MFSGEFMPVFSPELASEYESVLLGRAAKFHQMSEATVLDALADIVSLGETSSPPRAPTSAPDADDQHVWDLLHAVPDAVLVTGDKLLRSNPPTGREVLSPREFVERYLASAT